MSTATQDTRSISMRSLVQAVRAEQASRYVPPPVAATPAMVAVRSAHRGAGGTSVSLALMDALGAFDLDQRTLVDLDRSTRSGLVGAAEVETECDIPGWRRGLRGGGQILRPAGERFGLSPHVPGLTILDSPGPTEDARPVVVCRATLPSLRAADLLFPGREHHIAHLAVVGAGRWPKPIARIIPSGIADLYDEGRVTFFPHSSHLELFGVDFDPMPKPVVEAAARLAETLWPDLQRIVNRRTRKAVNR